MADGPLTQVADVVVPEIFTPYVQQITEEKSRIIQSGIAMRDARMDELLAGGGLTFNVPSFQDLDNDEDRVSTDTPYESYTGGVADPDPYKIETSTEIAVRLNRNSSWSSADLSGDLAGADPMNAIGNRVAAYWARRIQVMTVATMNGVIKDNDANDGGDFTHDVSGSAYTAGVTDFSAEAFIDAVTTMGDSQNELRGLIVHSIVYSRMQKNNLIDFIPDARGETEIATFLGREVIVDDGMPNAAGVFDTWIFGPGMLRFGVGSAKVPTAVERKEGAGNGGGQEVLYNRNVWSLHPVGFAYIGTSAAGGPGNGEGANELNNAASWNRVYPERKQISFARLVTREY